MASNTRTKPPEISTADSMLPGRQLSHSRKMSADQDDQHLSGSRLHNVCGYSLIELMIVLVIAGIIATGVVFMFANPSSKSKNQAFTLLGDLNMARSEAVNRNEDVLVDFIEGAVDGYQICVDVTPAGTPPGNGDCSDETGDNFIRETLFKEDIQFYDPGTLPTDGPATTPTSGSTANNLIGNTGILLDDGTPVTGIIMESDGTLDDAITKNINVVIFVPGDTHNEISGVPFAAVISASTGRIRISRWTNNAWKTK